MRPRTTRSCRRAFERPRRSSWRSCRRAAREPPWMVHASRCDTLRACVPPPAAELAVCGACAASRHVLIRAHDRRLLGLLGLEGPQAAGRSRVGSVPGLSVGWAAALDVLRSLHECLRACVTSCYRDALVCILFGTGFARADLGCTLDLRSDLRCFGHVWYVYFRVVPLGKREIYRTETPFRG
jgi:hypothetical protein